MPFLSKDQLDEMGFKRVGCEVQVSDKASIYNRGAIEIGDHSRIDDFCVISPGDGLVIGRHVHIAVFCSLIGKAKITLADFSGLSSRVSIYSSSDDYSGTAMTNPTVPNEFTNVVSKPVEIGRHVIVGAGSVILPGVTLHEGASIGALSLVKKDCEAFGMYFGTPANRIGARSRHLLNAEANFQSAEQ